MLKLHVELHVHVYCICHFKSNITCISFKSQVWYDVFLVDVVFKI